MDFWSLVRNSTDRVSAGCACPDSAGQTLGDAGLSQAAAFLSLLVAADLHRVSPLLISLAALPAGWRLCWSLRAAAPVLP